MFTFLFFKRIKKRKHGQERKNHHREGFEEGEALVIINVMRRSRMVSMFRNSSFSKNALPDQTIEIEYMERGSDQN